MNNPICPYCNGEMQSYTGGWKCANPSCMKGEVGYAMPDPMMIKAIINEKMVWTEEELRELINKVIDERTPKEPVEVDECRMLNYEGEEDE